MDAPPQSAAQGSGPQPPQQRSTSSSGRPAGSSGKPRQGPPPGAGFPTGGPGGPQLQFRGPNGQAPSPETIQAMQRKIAEDAQKAGLSVPQYIQQLKAQAMQQQQARMAAAQQGGGGAVPPGAMAPGGPRPGGAPGGPIARPGGPQRPGGPPGAKPITPGPPKPEALALAKFLRGQDLKPRTVILNGERKDMFRAYLSPPLQLVKRALRALESPSYEKARKKDPILPEIKDRASLENAFKLLPLSMLALRVAKIEPGQGQDSGGKKAKRVKGQWNVRIEPQQDAKDDMYYVWLWEGSQVMRKVYAGLALVAVSAIVMYPLWPLFLRQGVYYASWGLLGLLGLFFLMAIFRVILFCITYFVVPPGLWLYPNLWEDVSFMDSFRPVWAWHETTKSKKKKTKTSGSIDASNAFSATTGQPAPASATTTATETQIQTQDATQRSAANYAPPKVEELADDE
ncbi:hypothetical protein MKZ38_008194 [Zalerion maritima]|uniref:Translocation protein SEC62 n=1 Tax=Zalerion maritima TaxID=339359 RepID=A0AAD5RHZ3_9PEZI|nr:hypothetical protein MKZ38_008194 [Zalerion maritima]